MKQYACLILLLALFCSCSKDKQPNNPDNTDQVKKYPVVFNISGFTQTTTPMSVGGGDSTNNKTPFSLKVPTTVYSDDLLIYVVYDSNGNEVSRLEQQKSDPGKLYRIANNKRTLINSNSTYGQLNDTLGLGTYTVVATQGSSVASMNRPLQGQVDSQFPLAYPALPLSSATYYPDSAVVFKDAYLYKGSLTVSTTNTPQSITLKHITGQLVFNIEDALPSNASTFYYEISPEHIYFDINGNKSAGLLYGNGHHYRYITINNSDRGKAGYNYAISVLNTSTPLTVKLTVWAGGKVLATKTINNVVIKQNERTTLTGKLFDNTSSPFSITVDQTWGSNPTTINFTSPQTGTVTISGVAYPTVTIGNQIWTSVNYKEGTAAAISSIYGGYYTYSQASNVTLPPGWRLPSINDYNVLMANSNGVLAPNQSDYVVLGNDTYRLMSTSGWDSNGSGNNHSGFNALPNGNYEFVGNVVPGRYTELTSAATFLTSSKSSPVDPNWTPALFRISNYSSSQNGIPGAFLVDSQSSTATGAVRFVRDK